MNAANILKHLIKKKILNISSKKARELAYEVGADVVLGLEKKNSILLQNGKIVRLNNKLNFHVFVLFSLFFRGPGRSRRLQGRPAIRIPSQDIDFHQKSTLSKIL